MNNVTKFESKNLPGLFFWAEQEESGKGFWIVVAQVEGYPKSEAYDDWLTNQADAEDLAKKLAEDAL